LWGFNCPCVDLDFVVAEYNHGLPVALIEYKDKRAHPPDKGHPTYQALKALADGYKNGPLPFMIVTYCSELWWFVVSPMNEPAEQHYRHCLGQRLSEQRFVRSLHLLRKKTLSQQDEAAISQLSSSIGEGLPCQKLT
jgi:hypothetical protein